jgi:hypothetical protein
VLDVDCSRRCVLLGRTAFGLFQWASAARPYSQFCQAKIQNLGLIALRYEKICRLDVPVDDAFRMRRVQGVGKLDAQIQ